MGTKSWQRGQRGLLLQFRFEALSFYFDRTPMTVRQEWRYREGKPCCLGPQVWINPGLLLRTQPSYMGCMLYKVSYQGAPKQSTFLLKSSCLTFGICQPMDDEVVPWSCHILFRERLKFRNKRFKVLADLVLAQVCVFRGFGKLWKLVFIDENHSKKIVIVLQIFMALPSSLWNALFFQLP